jgi:hypothetical protein
VALELKVVVGELLHNPLEAEQAVQVYLVRAEAAEAAAIAMAAAHHQVAAKVVQALQEQQRQQTLVVAVEVQVLATVAQVVQVTHELLIGVKNGITLCIS